MGHLQPQNAAQNAIKNAVSLLLLGKDVSVTDFTAVCQQDREYARNFIAANETQLTPHEHSSYLPRAIVVKTTEWKLWGSSDFILNNHLMPWEQSFILDRLEEDPSEFSDQDLDFLLAKVVRADDPRRHLVIDALDRSFRTFVDQLAEGPLGLSEDIESLKRSVKDYGFDPDLNECLTKIDQQLENSADPFDQTATMKHIRSCYEKLHNCVAEELRKQVPATVDGTDLSKCQQVIDYLERKDVITEKIKTLGRCLYGILSDSSFGVHALKADRDYTRLCRNMVVEYAIVLIFELERRITSP